MDRLFPPMTAVKSGARRLSSPRSTRRCAAAAVVALVVLADGQSATEQELIAWCKDKAAGYKAPTSIEFRETLARTATGKLQKFKLRAPYWEGYDRQVH